MGVIGSHNVSLFPKRQKQPTMWLGGSVLHYHDGIQIIKLLPSSQLEICAIFVQKPQIRESSQVSHIPVRAPEMIFCSPERKAASHSTSSGAFVLIDQIEAKLHFSFHFTAASISWFIVHFTLKSENQTLSTQPRRASLLLLPKQSMSLDPFSLFLSYSWSVPSAAMLM